MIQLMNNSLDI